MWLVNTIIGASKRCPGLNVPPNLDPTLRILHLHNRPFIDKQARQRNRLWQGTAGIAPQVENETVHLFRRQFFQQSFDVA